MVNSYTGLSRHYDLIMTSGYYDYDDYARTLASVLEGWREVLELGVGTGLVCERLLALGEPGLRLTGIDHTEGMLAQARLRLAGRVRLVRQDILQMSLPSTFDAAYSVGGIWFYIRDQGDDLFCSHLLEEEHNALALRNLHAAMKPGSLLALASQGPHHSYERELPGGLVYAQDVRAAAGERFVKDYYVRRQDEVVAHQRCQFRLFSRAKATGLLERCGFRFEGTAGDGLFHLYARLP
ncbi:MULTISPECIES: class I SAM-dependent methyltransferase [unclassified Streptomyces]|uniref:class I SAM-dependent methyltransferase n=1 Tax=unclassified Streptomyces TaxID=2593676 RepID=UPI0034205379